MSRLFLIEEPIKVVNKRFTDFEQMLPEYAAMLRKRGATETIMYEAYLAKFIDG
jgi:hypothetical protein